MKHRLQYLFLRVTLFVLCIIPRKAALGLATVLGKVMYRIGIRRRAILANLRICFPEWSEEERNKVAQGAWIHFAKTIVEMARFPRMTDEFLRKNIKIEGRAEFEPLLWDKKTNGILAVAGHLGNYEIGPAVALLNGYPFCAIYQPARNKMVNDYLLRLRESRGQKAIPWKRAMKEGFEALARNEMLATLPDQDAGERGLFVDFFGVPASTKTGQGKLAHRSKCTVVTMFIHRELDDTYVIHLGRPIDYDKDADEKTITLQITEEFTRRLEAMIRRYPDQYFWLHKRFKTRPPQENPPLKIYE